MKGRLLVILGFVSTIIFPIFPARASAATSTSTATVIISEIKLGGDSYSQGADQPKDSQEFITLFNQSNTDIDLSGWVLEYAKSTYDKSYCSDSNWIGHNISGSASQTLLSGTLKSGQVSTPIIRSLTDNAAGSLHLADLSDKNNPVVQDLVGWGASAPCFKTNTTGIPSNGKSIKRFLGCNNLPIDTSDNSKDFSTNQPPSPGTLNYPLLNTCQQDESATNPESSQLIQTCEGAMISEILPNPSGTDANSEFIELFNPTASAITLQGCSLQTTANTNTYSFTNINLQPGEYRAFYSLETSLTLPNSAGGTVWLLSPNTELQAVTYLSGLDDNVSWANYNGSWQASYQPTPNAANILLSTKPCPVGEERNSDTGYCHTVASLTTSNLSVCKEGQERNPETNRCRAIVTASATKNSSAKSKSNLVPCKAGQERNSATNRCKSIVTTASAKLKPCPVGQQRNLQTNRCRKVSSNGASGKLASVKDSASGSISKNPHWWLAGFAAFGASSYGIYEWRQEVLQYFRRFTAKLPFISAK
jgi:hypothetical protein